MQEHFSSKLFSLENGQHDSLVLLCHHLMNTELLVGLWPAAQCISRESSVLAAAEMTGFVRRCLTEKISCLRSLFTIAFNQRKNKTNNKLFSFILFNPADLHTLNFYPDMCDDRKVSSYLLC